MTEAKQRTPEEIGRTAAALMGGIDCSPDSREWLSREWYGRVFVVAPYSRGGGFVGLRKEGDQRGSTLEWSRKVISEYDSGRVTQAIVLLPSRPDTKWFRLFNRFPVCFIEGRMRMNGKGAAPFPSAIAALGIDTSLFAAAFSAWGDTYGCATSQRDKLKQSDIDDYRALPESERSKMLDSFRRLEALGELEPGSADRLKMEGGQGGKDQ